ncbi:hypothetical protein HRbin32_01151 [bacterium HR32]|nr:hypothetical protein HRbin32_01151 [bacterium HR32]
MSRFRGSTLGHVALLVVAALVATACGTSQTAQAPSPSPSPSPPAGTVAVHGKVLQQDMSNFTNCIQLGGPCTGSPVRDGVVVAAYDDALAISSAAAAPQRVLNHPRAAKFSKRLLDRIRQGQELARRVAAQRRPAPGQTPLATDTTSNGEYRLNVPASFVGKKVLVCVQGLPFTDSPNPGDPALVGVCTTMTVHPPDPGNTAVNTVNFLTTSGVNMLVAVRRADTGASLTDPVTGLPTAEVLPQTVPVDLVFAGPVSATLKSCLDSANTFGLAKGIFTADPAAWPFNSGYGTQLTALAAPIRIVSSLPSANVYRFRGAVQWRTDRVVDVPYLLNPNDNCGIITATASVVVVQMSANLGQAAAPMVTSMTQDMVVMVRQDTRVPDFNPTTGPFAESQFVPAGYNGQYDRSENDSFIPFNEPINDATGPNGFFVLWLGSWGDCTAGPAAPAVTAGQANDTSGPACSLWTLFAPANDIFNWSKAGAAGAVFDAHRGVSVAVPNDDPATVLVHTNNAIPGDQPDALMAIRLNDWADDVRSTGNNQGEIAGLPNGATVLVMYSAGLGNAWATSADPTFIVDLAGNQTFPPNTAKGGVIVP